MKTLLRAKVLAGDEDFLARFGLVRFDLGDPWALIPIADRVSFDFCSIGPLDRFGIVEGKSCAINNCPILIAASFNHANARLLDRNIRLSNELLTGRRQDELYECFGQGMRLL